MKPTIVIPATQAITDEYRLAQSRSTMAEERTEPMTFGTNKLESKVFLKGRPLGPENCFLVNPFDGWDPKVVYPLADKIPLGLKDRLEKEWSPEGLAGFIAMTDTVGGVREEITYDENEAIIKPLLEDPHEED